MAAVVALIAIGLLNAPAGSAQSQESFDVASVKLNKNGGRGRYPGLAPGGQRFTATNLPLLALIMLAYNVTPRQISGVPSSFNTEGYDIEATCDHPLKQEQALRMLQTLLADRFKLTLHRETREQPIHALVVGKGGSKLHESPEESTPDAQKTGRGFVYKSTPMSVLSLVLSQVPGRTVVDKTGLSGRYDFSLEYMPERVGRGVAEGRELAPDSDGLPSVFTAVQEQLLTKSVNKRDLSTGENGELAEEAGLGGLLARFPRAPRRTLRRVGKMQQLPNVGDARVVWPSPMLSTKLGS